MILTRLIAQGFKSFADRTEFEFDRGITAIVGPNGCGKSNVVDAIRWVLGEQSAKSLRGKQMLDVIFNGSGTRRPGNVAQVDLVFDNSDGQLPIDQVEVIVSRRLYRSGESEYLLNKQVCRLRDVRELFMDTGVGVDAYSVIEQGRVDALLQANPLERRLIFEEAAGISKFKARKREAQRKLERVDHNLLRLTDIIEELEKRLRSIKLAAGKARSYQEYTARLRALRSRYTLANYHDLRQTQAALEREAGEWSDQSTGLRTRLSESETRASQAQVRANDLERETAALDGRVLETQSAISAGQERLAAARRRTTEQAAALERGSRRLDEQDARCTAAEHELASARQRCAAAEAESAELQARLAALAAEERELAAEIERGRHALEDEKGGILDLMRRTSQMQNEIHGGSIQAETLSGHRQRLAAREAQLADQLTDLLSRRRALEERGERIAQLLRDQAEALAATRARAAAVAERGARLREQLAAAKEYRSGLLARQKTLAELDRRREGLTAGAREVLAQRDADPSGQRFSYVLGPIGELFEADVAHAGIVEAVLGELEQCLVVTARDALLSDRETIAKIEGRVPAFCLDQVPPGIAAPELSGQAGFVAWVADWVRVPESCEKLARYLLGRTVIVESTDDARRLSALFPVGLRFVTLDGIVWEPDGRIALGSLGAGTGLITRRSELRELGDQIADAEARIAALATQAAQADGEAAHVETVLAELQSAMHAADTERVEAETNLAAVAREVEQLSREQPLLAAEAQAVTEQLAEAARRVEQSRGELESLERSGAERQRRIERLDAALREKAARHAVLAEQLTQTRVAAGEAGQRRAALGEAVAAAEADFARATQEGQRLRQELDDVRAAAAEAQTTVAETESALERLTGDLARLTREAAALREQRERLRMELDEQAHEQRRLRGELEGVEAELHLRRQRLAEVRVRIEDLELRTRDELGVELSEQYVDYVPQNENWPAVEVEIEDLRGKIERLGNVNLDAIAEQAELEQRHGFLATQRDDLLESKRQLLGLIERLDADSRSRFIETFETVRAHFGEMFRKLFGGGRADVTLLDPADVLECGIEITARPPGKEPRNIALLSGGEKTMTAIALLLAVFKTRPSPFALLDEVDAALDEANNERFNRLVREFLAHSQFIIITHSKRTMSIADVLYGVTMQEAGVSKRVAVRLEEAEPAVQSAVA